MSLRPFVCLLLCLGVVLSLRIKFVTDYIDLEPTRSCRVADKNTKYYRGPQSNPTTCEDTEFDNSKDVPATDCLGLCQSQDVITQQQIDQLNNVVFPRVTSKLQSLLSIPPAMQSNPWILPSSAPTRCKFFTNDGITIPSQWKTTGMNNTDLVIIVLMRPMALSVYSQGLYCVTDPTTKRPLLGLLNIPVPMVVGSAPDQIYNMVMQQVLHIMGFHYPILTTIYSASPVTKTVNGASRTTQYLTLPATSKALANYRKHTGCSTITQIELEDQQLLLKAHLWANSVQTDANSYFERRAFFNELMTGNYLGAPSDGPVISPITLGIMEDLTWYVANYTNADRYVWGKNTGCMLQEQQCEKWVTDQNAYTSRSRFYWCDALKPNAYCTFDFNSKGNCDVVKYDRDITPAYYQHFSDKAFAGLASINDNCPVINRIAAGDCRISTNGVSNDRFSEVYGNTSRCMMSSLTGQDYDRLSAPQSTCLQTACGPLSNDTMDISLFVKIGAYWALCPRAGGELTDINRNFGTLYCPPYDTICTDNTTSFNWNWDVSDRAKNSPPQDLNDYLAARIAALPWWVWFIIAIGIVLIIVFIVTTIVLFVIGHKRHQANKREEVNVVDLRNKKKEKRYEDEEDD
jgi:hypothetical protein